MYLRPTKRQSYGGVSSDIAQAGGQIGKAANKFTSSLSKGEIIGIVVAIIVILVIVIGSIWWFCVRSAKKRDSMKEQEEEEEKRRIREISVRHSSSSAFGLNDSLRHKGNYWQDIGYIEQRRGSDVDTFENGEFLQKGEYHRPAGTQMEYGMALTSMPEAFTQQFRPDYHQYHQQHDDQQLRSTPPKYDSQIYTSSQC